MAAAKGSGAEKPAGKGGGKAAAGGKKDDKTAGNKLNPNDPKAKGAAATATAAVNADNKQPTNSGDANRSSLDGGPEAASNPGGIFFPPHWNTKLSLKPTTMSSQQPQFPNNNNAGMVDSAASSMSAMATPIAETESDSDITKMEPFDIVTDDLATVMVLLECPELHIVMKVLDNLCKRMDNSLAEKQQFLARHGLEKILFYTQHVRMPLVRRATVLVGLLAMNEECHDDMLKVENGAVVPLMLALLVPDMDRVVHEWSTLALARLSEHSLTRYLLVYDFNGARMLQRTLQPMKQVGGGGGSDGADPDVVLNTLIIWQHLLEEDSISEDTKKLQLNRVLDACREQMRTSEFVRLKLAALKVMTLAANVKAYRDYLLGLKMLEELKTLLFDEPNCETPEACYALLANLFYDTGVQADFEDSGLLYAIVNHLYTYAPQPKPTSAATAALAAAAAAAAAAEADDAVPVDSDAPVPGAPAAEKTGKLDKIAEYAIQIIALSSRIPDMAWVLSKKLVDKLLIWFIETATTEQTAALRGWAFVALKHMSDIAASRKVMMQNKLGHAVLKSLSREVSHDAGMERLLLFLSRFVQQDEECGRYLLDSGIVAELVKQLRKFSNNNNTATSSSTAAAATGSAGVAPPVIIAPTTTATAPIAPPLGGTSPDDPAEQQQQQQQHRPHQRHLNYLDDARVQANMIGVFTSLGMFARLMRDINQKYSFTTELAHVLTRCEDAPYLLEQTIMALQLYMQQPRARHEFITTPVQTTTPANGTTAAVSAKSTTLAQPPTIVSLIVDAIGRVKREFIKPLMNVISMSIVNETIANEFIRAGTWEKLQILTFMSSSSTIASTPIGGASTTSSSSDPPAADYTDAVNLVRQKLLEGDTAFKFATVGVLSPLNRVTDGFYDFDVELNNKNGGVALAKSFPLLEDVLNDQSKVFSTSSSTSGSEQHQPLTVYYISTRDPLPPPSSAAKEQSAADQQQESQTDISAENNNSADTPESSSSNRPATGGGQTSSPASASGKKAKSGGAASASSGSGGTTAGNTPTSAANAKLSRQSTQQQPVKDDQQPTSTSLKPSKKQPKSSTSGDNNPASNVSLGGRADEQQLKSGGTAKSPLLRSGTITLGNNAPTAADSLSVGSTPVPPPATAASAKPATPPAPPAFHPPCDTRLLDFARAVHQELRCYQYLVNRTVVLARMVAERMGGVTKNSDKFLQEHQQTVANHLQQLRKYLNTTCIPLGYVRQGGFHQRALLFKFCADFFHIPCSLHRSTTPVSNLTAATNNVAVVFDSNQKETAPNPTAASSKQQPKPNNKILPPLNSNRFSPSSPQNGSNKSTSASENSDIRYWNIIYVGKPSEPFLVDLMFSPGALIPMHLPAAKLLIDFYCQPHTDKTASNIAHERETGSAADNPKPKTLTYQDYLRQLPGVALKLPYEIPKLRGGADGNGAGADGANSADGDQSSVLGGASGIGGSLTSGKRGRKGVSGATALTDGATSITSGGGGGGTSATPMFTGTPSGALAPAKSIKPGLSPGGNMNAATGAGTGGAKTPTPSTVSAPSTTAANLKGAKKHGK